MSNFSSVNAQSLPAIPIIPGANTNDNALTNDILNGIAQQEQTHVIPFDPIAGGALTQYSDSQNYPYQDPYQIPESPVQTLPGDSFPLEEQEQLLSQENSIVDVIPLETTLASVVDGNNIPLQEGATTTSNKVVITIQGTDDVAVTGFQCVLDNLQQDPSICGTNPVVAENLPPGAHLFQISSVDLAGNVDATPATFGWNVIVSDQNLGGQQMSQQLQQQQLPILPSQEQQMLPYQTNISPYVTVVPNPSNSNATAINENLQTLQPLPPQNFQTANPIPVPPQFSTIDPYQPLDAKQYQYQQNLQQQPLQQSSQNTSGLQQPPATSPLSPFPNPSFDYSHQQIATTNETTRGDQNQIQRAVPLEPQTQDNQSLEIQAPAIAAGDNLGENLTSSLDNILDSSQVAIPAANTTNATSNNNTLQDTAKASASSTVGSYTVTYDGVFDHGIGQDNNGNPLHIVVENHQKYTGEISNNGGSHSVDTALGTCELKTTQNGVVTDQSTKSPTHAMISQGSGTLFFGVAGEGGITSPCDWPRWALGEFEIPYFVENDVVRAVGQYDSPPCETSGAPGAFCSQKHTWDISAPGDLTNPNTRPNAVATASPTTAESGATVTLVGSASNDPDPGDSIASYLWEQDPNDTVRVNTLRNANTEKADFDAPFVTQDTILNFKLTVTDTKGAPGTTTVQVTVKPLSNTPPTPQAQVLPSTTVVAGTKVILDASKSTDKEDPQGSLSFKWSPAADNQVPVTLTNPTTAKASFVAPQVSDSTSLNFNLEVKDTKGAIGIADVLVTIAVQPPGDFSITCPQNTRVNKGHDADISCTVNSLQGFNGEVDLSCNGSPTEPSISCSTNLDVVTLTSGGTAPFRLNVATTSDTPTGAHNIEIEGMSGSIQQIVAVPIECGICLPPRTENQFVSQQLRDFLEGFEGRNEFLPNDCGGRIVRDCSVTQDAYGLYNDHSRLCTMGIGSLLNRAHPAHCNQRDIDNYNARFPGGMTRPQALALFEQDIATEGSNPVNQRVRVQLTQEQFDALVSFTFNVGPGGLRDSRLLRDINRSNCDPATIEADFLRYTRAGNDRDALRDRRLQEANLFNNGVYP